MALKKGEGRHWSFNDPFFGVEGAKNGNFWKFLGNIGLRDQFLTPQEPKILWNFCIFSKNSPITVKQEDFIA